MDGECPIPSTHDKFTEAHYFLSRMTAEYHQPAEFRWNLNAFLQALKAVPGMASRELQARPGFKDWWGSVTPIFRQDPLLKRFARGRDIVVHRGMLAAHSEVKIGLFRGRRLKLAFGFPLPVEVPSDVLLRDCIKRFTGDLIGADHVAIGEQLGIQRKWIVPELSGEEDILEVSYRAWAKAAPIVESGHTLVRFVMPSITSEPGGHTAATVGVLLEEDLDPDLPAKWGWTD